MLARLAALIGIVGTILVTTPASAGEHARRGDFERRVRAEQIRREWEFGRYRWVEAWARARGATTLGDLTDVCAGAR
jgi:hypothetical protein